MKIVIDTNTIIYAVKRKIDLKEAVRKLTLPNPQIIIPDSVINELENLKEKAKRGSDKTAANLALQIIKHSKFKIEEFGEGHTDYLIANWAQTNKAAVITSDAAFSLKLKELGVPIYSLRQKKYLSKR